MQKENELDQDHLILGTYSKSCEMHQLAIMYRLEHANHDTHPNFLFENLEDSFYVRLI